jgi:transcriptional regulator with XRE-family HTH domain
MVGDASIHFPAERVKMIRALKRMTQEQFAEHYGISVNTLSRLENNETQYPSGPTLGALLQAARETGA